MLTQAQKDAIVAKANETRQKQFDAQVQLQLTTIKQQQDYIDQQKACFDSNCAQAIQYIMNARKALNDLTFVPATEADIFGTPETKS